MDAKDIDAFVAGVRFGPDGLAPVTVQQHGSGEVLMLAWMNADALRETLTTGRLCYWSRSRQTLWRKGETSGQIQTLREMLLDCDNDALLAVVEQKGVACHTGRRSCFFQRMENGSWKAVSEPLVSADTLYGKKT